MTNAERIRPSPTFEIDVSPMGVKLNVWSGKKVPHADLVQAMMNAGACTEFGLEPSWNSEGGVEGIYRRTYIGLENLGEDEIGVLNTAWQSVPYLRQREVDALDKVLGYYEVFLNVMFDSPIKIEEHWYPPEILLIHPELQTREAVWDRILYSFANSGGGSFPKKVQSWLINQGEMSRRFLRGLTDFELFGK